MNKVSAIGQSIEARRLEISSSVAMTIGLVSFSMLFATLMLGYFSYLFTADIWPPMGMERVSLGLPTISTVLILMSSLAYYTFESNFIAIDKKAKIYFYVTSILGLTFMGCQSLLWYSLKEHGVFVGSSVFASMIYAFTWIHAAHVLGGLIALVCLIPTFSGKRTRAKSLLWVKNIGLYWHFLGIVWVMIYFSLFVY